MYDYIKSQDVILSFRCFSGIFWSNFYLLYIYTELIEVCQISKPYTDTMDINTNSCRVIYKVPDQLFEVSTKLRRQMINEDLSNFFCQINKLIDIDGFSFKM